MSYIGKRQLEGKIITAVRQATEGEKQTAGITEDKQVTVLELDDGTVIFPTSADTETIEVGMHLAIRDGEESLIWEDE